jgi:PAS domain S-box-containing protein
MAETPLKPVTEPGPPDRWRLLGLLFILSAVLALLAPTPWRVSDHIAAVIATLAVLMLGVGLVGLRARRRQSVEAELALRASVAREGSVVESALDAIVAMDHLGRILEFNPAAERMFGHRRAAVIGQPMDEQIVPPALRERHRSGLARYLATGESTLLGRRVEMTALRADGTEFPVELAISRVPGSDPPRFNAFLRDITERRKVEDDLRGTLALLTATLESTADGILVVDAEGRIVNFNSRFASMWRIPKAVLDARDDDQAIAFVLSQLKEPAAFVAKVREVYRADTESFDAVEFKDGRVFERYSLPRRIDGRNIGRVWSFRDVTERRRAEKMLHESEDQLRQAQKMEAIGRLAGGVAHDFNNLLTIILGYTEHMLPRLSPARDPELLHAVSEIQAAADRAAALTGRLLAFSRKQILEPKELDLNRALLRTSEMLRRLIGEHITLDVKLDPALGHVLADENQIEQVILNLVVNARDAMPEGGHLTLTTCNAEVDESTAPRRLPLAPGRYVMLTVGDTGVGMDEETRLRAFEPFFTTKEAGKGTGLGLSTVYGIVQQSGGFVWVYSEVGKGTVFKIYLPRLDTPAPKGAESKIIERTPTGSETVLLVEDEAMLRDLLQKMLVSLGYQVTTTTSSQDALNYVSGCRSRIDLMVTDVVMPGLAGPVLAERVALLHPETRTLFVSGYTDDAVLRHGVKTGLAAFLQKPFTLDALARKVREVLDAPRPV